MMIAVLQITDSQYYFVHAYFLAEAVKHRKPEPHKFYRTANIMTNCNNIGINNNVMRNNSSWSD